MILEGSEIKDSGTLNTSLEGTELFAPHPPNKSSIAPMFIVQIYLYNDNDKWKNDELFD